MQKIQAQIDEPFLQQKATPAKLEEKIYENLPEATGVYYLYNQVGELLYIGKSTNIKNRIKSHFRLDMRRKKDIELKGQIANIDFKLYPHDLVAKIMESMEVKKYRPPFNVALKRNRYRYEVKLEVGPEGHYYFHHRPFKEKQFQASQNVTLKELSQIS